MSLESVFGPSGHESLAQGLPWETRPNMRSPEGATGISGICSFAPRQRAPLQGLQALKPKTQGKPWAKFFSPFWAGPFGLRDHAKRQQLPTRLELRLTPEVRGGNLQRAPVRTFELEASARAWSDDAHSGCRPSPDH
jgi:hypothetical protein